MRAVAQVFERYVLITDLRDRLRNELVRALESLRPDLFHGETESSPAAVLVLFQESKKSDERNNARKIIHRPPGLFGTNYRVSLYAYRIPQNSGRQVTAGELVISEDDEEETVLHLTVCRYLVTLALVKKSESFKGKETADPKRPSFRCRRPQIEMVVFDYAYTHPQLKSYLQNKVEFSDDINHLKVALRESGAGGLIKGTLGSGLYLDTAPESVSFYPAEQWHSRGQANSATVSGDLRRSCDSGFEARCNL